MVSTSSSVVTGSVSVCAMAHKRMCVAVESSSSTRRRYCCLVSMGASSLPARARSKSGQNSSVPRTHSSRQAQEQQVGALFGQEVARVTVYGGVALVVVERRGPRLPQAAEDARERLAQ